ncbi:hypothetical protein KFE25_013017 [Diacronema lutheri]|uniref:VTT domain-containing protein n=2 Tax=Diacronema lutheri TaxID=2081491 RepID=A0A8J6C5N4_DIALT|nr:hypothetical protein KFE25_013017 [Diacronema lutheri]
MPRLTLNQSLAAYAALTAAIAIGGAAFVRSAPPLPAAQCARIVTPMDVVRGRLVREPRESILGLWTCLKEYKRDNWWYTTAGIWGTYVLFKVFGPLGAGTSMVISILIGALYDEWAISLGGLRYSMLAHLLGVSGEVCGGIGGYVMSYLVGREILLAFAAEKMGRLEAKMREYDGSLFRYMLFLRVSPMLPNWFVNYGTPLVGMPLSYFAAASVLAIQPAAAMSIAMGGMVREAGEAGLDLRTFAQRGAAMASTSFVLSLPLIPADDLRAAKERARAVLGLGQSPLEQMARS